MNNTKSLIHKSLLGVAIGLSLLAGFGAVRTVTVVAHGNETIHSPMQLADGSETHGVKSPPKRA